jgi:hypothetical protein
MITSLQIEHSVNASEQKEMPYGLGNTLFMIAGVIGIATKNGYDFGFASWRNQEFFVNPLPGVSRIKFGTFRMPVNYKGFDIGFVSFDVPDDCAVHGYLGSEKYFVHCRDLIRYYFMMKDLIIPFRDSILIHHRYYPQMGFTKLNYDNYYGKALKQLPDRRIIVVTNDVENARKAIRIDCEYINNSPIIDFYLLTKADYLIMGNSTFSWWGAWLSNAKVVAPLEWFTGDFKDCPTKDLYCDDWLLI